MFLPFVDVPLADLIPLTFLGSLTTGTIAFVGVMLTLKHHRKREKASAEYNLRREVYLGACEAMLNAIRYATNLANPDITDEALQSLVESYGPATSKVHLVGTCETIRCVIDFDNILNQNLFAMAPIRAKMVNLNFRIRRTIDARQEVERDLFKKKLAGDAYSATSLTSSDDKIKESQQDLMALRVSMLRASLLANSTISPVFESFILASRRELDFRINEAEYIALQKGHSEKTKAVFEKLMSDLSTTSP